MAVRPATFTGFHPYKLTGVRVTDQELGHGAYATVLELEYMGLKCAGKKIHELLLEQGGASYAIRGFEEECRLLSQVRHPNIVQFLGVYFQEGVRAPTLVMEFLPTNLTSCIEQYGILTKEISYSILHDVALGLHYLHSQIPAIIHQDLSSNNVLLSHSMTAKISDLGVARIFNLTPLQIKDMTEKPGTQDFMPPEALVPNPLYTSSIDVFSYGIMMIHIFSGKWPAQNERTALLQNVRDPLTDFIDKCIHDISLCRPTSTEIVQRMKQMVRPLAASENLRVKNLESEVKELKEKIKKKESEFPNLHKGFANEIARLKIVHETDLILKDNELKTKEALIAQLQENITSLTAQLVKMRQALPASLAQPIKLTWRRCSDIRDAMYDAHATVIKGKIYVGGGTVNNDDKYGVHCYDPLRDKWTTLPSAPVRYFGLGRVNNQLVTVGGMKKDEMCTNELYMFDEIFLAWQQTLPSMPTAIKEPVVLSLESMMVVCSSTEMDNRGIFNEVDIFKSDTMQWHKGVNQLPGAARYSMSMLMIACENKCYALGGHQGQKRSNEVFYVSLDKEDGDAQENSSWKTLQDTPSFQPAAVEIAGNLCVVGGWNAEAKGNTINRMYMYSPERGNTWAYIGDLPEPLSEATIAAVSNTSFFVIGGRDEHGRITKTVYNCTVESHSIIQL